MNHPAIRPFLTAQWTNLGIITFAADPKLLHPHLPPMCELDCRDGQAFVSLVAFDFCDTCVRGIRWLGQVNFPEINLRTYVRCGELRGVTFIRELVPRRIVATIARSIYNEPYRVVPMTSRISDDENSLSIHHRIRICHQDHTIHVTGRKPAFCPDPQSIECFFKEHQWGFGRSRRNDLLRYEVRHPIWNVYRDPVLQLNWDFAAIYGEPWAYLNQTEPISVILAAGSEVQVFPKL